MHGMNVKVMEAKQLLEMLYVAEGGHISEGCILIATFDLKLNAPFACT